MNAGKCLLEYLQWENFVGAGSSWSGSWQIRISLQYFNRIVADVQFKKISDLKIYKNGQKDRRIFLSLLNYNILLDKIRFYTVEAFFFLNYCFLHIFDRFFYNMVLFEILIFQGWNHPHCDFQLNLKNSASFVIFFVKDFVMNQHFVTNVWREFSF